MVRAGFEFRMGLCSYIERVPCDLDHLYNMIIRGSSYDMSFLSPEVLYGMHCLLHNDVCGAHGFLFCQRVHRIWNLLQEYMDNFQVLRFHRYLRYLPDPALMQLPDALSPDSVQYCLHLRIQVHAGKFYNCHLHSQADSKIWNLMYSCILCCQDHSFCTSVSETTRNQDTIYIVKLLIQILFMSVLRNRSSQALPLLCRKFRHVSVPPLH